MEEVKRIVIQSPIPFSTKHVYLALEEDRFDHDEQILEIAGIHYGAVSRRNPNHPRYDVRGSDSLEMIYEKFPEFIGLDAGILRDCAAGCIIY